MKTVNNLVADAEWTEQHKHAVQFYQNDRFLAEAVAHFIAEGLIGRQPVLVVATQRHRKLFTETLLSLAIDVERAKTEGHLTCLDAHRTLSAFMENGMPNPERFARRVGGAIDKIWGGREGVKIRVFGEMVDLLWHAGHRDAAIRLEELWNELALTRPFSLLCAYRVGNLYKETLLPQFQAVRDQHECTLATEDPGPRAEDERPAEVTPLRQHPRD